MKDIQFHFEDKNFVVVGASSGIGRQIALDLAEAGAHVLAVARNKDRLIEAKKAFPDLIDIKLIDVLEANAEEWSKALGEFVGLHGKINGGVYTAGIAGVTALKMYDEEFAERILDTSFWGMARFIQRASKKKYAAKNSSYVVLSSIAAYLGNKGQFAYSGAKAAVQAAVKSWSKEICSDGHRINSISPAWTETNMTKNPYITPDNLFASYHLGTGKTEDISGVALFLLSDAARWITGTDILVDGGCTLGAV